MSGNLSRAIRQRLDEAEQEHDSTKRGALYESLIRDIFETIPGISFTTTKVVNPRRSQEIDIAFWNNQHQDGFWFLPIVILTECKNWLDQAGSIHVVSFND